MMLRVLLIVLYLSLCGIYALLAMKRKSKLLWVCVGCWLICAVLNLYILLARC